MTEIDRFLEALRRQQSKYRELASLAQEQKKVLGGGDIDALMGIVEQKRAIMGGIEEMEKILAPTKGRWSELRASLDDTVIREVEAAVEETKRLLEDLVRMEDEAREVLERQRTSTAIQLKDLMTKKRARGAYGGPGGAGPRFIDGQK